MSAGGGGATPGGAGASAGASAAPPLDDRDVEPRTPMKRLGSTRKLAAFSSEYAYITYLGTQAVRPRRTQTYEFDIHTY